MLVEFLPGCTLDEIILTTGQEAVDWVLTTLEATLWEIWEATKEHKAAEPHFVRQIQDRLEAIGQIHPEFVRHEKEVGAARIESSESLLKQCAEIEKEIVTPFTVFVHGDFNTNNIVFDQGKERIHFVDLSRSGLGDYVQDGSVFLISNFRMPVFDQALRDRLNGVIDTFFDFLSRFASENQDETFEARMALGLARSFYTSTRFETNFDFAKDMYFRALFLLEKIRSHKDRPWRDFRLARHVLYY
jgi:hypothetical protein